MKVWTVGKLQNFSYCMSIIRKTSVVFKQRSPARMWLVNFVNHPLWTDVIITGKNMFASFSYLGKIPEEQIARSIIYGHCVLFSVSSQSYFITNNLKFWQILNQTRTVLKEGKQAVVILYTIIKYLVCLHIMIYCTVQMTFLSRCQWSISHKTEAF